MAKKKVVEKAGAAIRSQNYGDYDYFGWPKKDDLPRIILGIVPPDYAFEEKPKYTWKEPRFGRSRIWQKIAHQTAGLSCHQRHIIGTILTPKSLEIETAVKSLCDKWLDSNMGCFGLGLAEANEYSNDLKRLFGKDVSCESSWRHLEEAWYPVDCTKDALSVLTSDILPENLDDLIEWGNGWERAYGCINRWTLVFCGENSD
jgi:hypothetical protein